MTRLRPAHAAIWKRFAILEALLLCLGLGAGPAHAADEPGGWRVGLFPNLSPVALVRLYAPLRNDLSARLQAPVRFYTAANFRAYLEALTRGRYDIAVAPPELAWYAVDKCGYVPLARYTAQIRGILVVRKDGPVRSIEDLRGARIAFPDPLALVTQAIRHALAGDGLSSGTDYQVVMAQSHNNAALMVMRGQATAAGIGLIPLRSLPHEVADELRVIYTTPPPSTQYIVIKACVPAPLRQRVLGALQSFAASPEGRAFLARGGLGDIVPADAAGLDAYRKYLPPEFDAAP